MTKRLTKTAKLLNALGRGEQLTSEQIARRFGLVNVSSTIHRLRTESNVPIRSVDGDKVWKYRLNTKNRTTAHA